MAIRTAMQFAQTARQQTARAAQGRPPQVRLERIMSAVERIQMLRTCTEQEREQALQVCWDAYASILSRIDSEQDESWSGARERGGEWTSEIPLVDDETFVLMRLYGEADVD